MSRGERQAGRTEALFREANEAIQEGMWPEAAESPVRFRCECASPACNLAVEVTPERYEAVRESSRRFVVLPGHERTELETVVEVHDRFLIVAKRGEAGALAEATDPRA